MDSALIPLADDSGRLYHPIEHPDFSGWPVAQACEDRWAMIERFLGATSPGKALDIGAHTGWFSRRLARAGWDVTAIERSPEWSAAGMHLSAMPSPCLSPAWRVGDAREMEMPSADLALVLSVMMYLHQDEEYHPAMEFLDRVSVAAPLMLLDYGGMYRGDMPIDETVYASFVLARTQYKVARRLGTSAMGRGLWAFERASRTRVTWAIGATGVGKRTWIARHDLTPAWVTQDERTADEVRAEIDAGARLVRWQWGREDVLRDLVRSSPGVEHVIAHLTAHPVEVAGRRYARGERGVDPCDCAHEAGAVSHLVASLRSELGLVVEEVKT